MTDMLGKAAAWLDRQRHAHLTIAVVFACGDDRVELQASVGKTQFESTDDYGRVLRTESRDYLVRAADLVLADAAVLPQPGDLIIEDGRRYEVMAPGGEPEWRWADVNQTTLRIHTKQIDEE